MNCPVDGCDYENPNEKALKGHWGGMRDEAHSGAWHKAMAEAEGSDSPARAGATETDESPPEGDTDTNPTFGSAEVETGTETEPADTSEEVDLPCGHESFAPAEAPEPPFRVSCEECGEAWNVTDL